MASLCELIFILLNFQDLLGITEENALKFFELIREDRKHACNEEPLEGVRYVSQSLAPSMSFLTVADLEGRNRRPPPPSEFDRLCMFGFFFKVCLRMLK